MSNILNYPVLFALVSFFGLALAAWVGARFQKARRILVEEEREGFAVVQAATLTLLGLIWWSLTPQDLSPETRPIPLKGDPANLYWLVVPVLIWAWNVWDAARPNVAPGWNGRSCTTRWGRTPRSDWRSAAEDATNRSMTRSWASASKAVSDPAWSRSCRDAPATPRCSALNASAAGTSADKIAHRAAPSPLSCNGASAVAASTHRRSRVPVPVSYTHLTLPTNREV